MLALMLNLYWSDLNVYEMIKFRLIYSDLLQARKKLVLISIQTQKAESLWAHTG